MMRDEIRLLNVFAAMLANALASVVILLVIASVSVTCQQPKSTSAGKDPVRERPLGSIVGTVTDEGGRPMVDATVMVAALAGNKVIKTEATDEQGKFSVAGLVSGAYRLRVRSPGYIQPDEELRTADGLNRFYLTGENVSITLVKGGVITGTVTDSSGNPLVGMSVTAMRVREPGDPSGIDEITFGPSRSTDDRGIYRIYGLRAGRYLVYVRSDAGYSRVPRPFDHDAPTYYPSSTRDLAGILNVQPGQELSGIDVRYRGDRGYTISGTLNGALQKFATLSLMIPGNPTAVAASFSQERDGSNSFAITNVSSGDYKIIAYSTDDKIGRAVNGTLSVSVKNSDVTGLVINLSPLATISGRVNLSRSPGPKCANAAASGLEHVILSAEGEQMISEDLFAGSQRQTAAGPNGDFSVGNLSGGSYRMRTQLPTDDWYISSITRAPAQQKTQTVNAPAESFFLRNGEDLAGVTIDLVTGAGSVAGRVTIAGQTPELLTGRRIYLIPSEKERSDDTLRFGDSAIWADGRFGFRNLAPGRYFLLSRVVKETQNRTRPLYWDAKERAALVREANDLGLVVEIKPCQNIDELGVSLGRNGLIK
jgi:hypothetical protein